MYVDVTGLASGEQVGLGLVLVDVGDHARSEPARARPISHLVRTVREDCNPTPSPLEWQYATGSGSGDTVLSIGTEFDPNIPDANPIVSQTEAQYGSGRCLWILLL